jgi:clan AA aspartic protease
MIRGEVTEDRVARLHLQIADAEGMPTEVVFTVDTGFTGDLTLPPTLINDLGLTPTGLRGGNLADGQAVEILAYRTAILWNGALRTVIVYEIGEEPLLGMSLIWGHRTTINAVAGGEVLVEEL